MPLKEAKRRIQEARKSGATRLDLSSLEISNADLEILLSDLADLPSHLLSTALSDLFVDLV